MLRVESYKKGIVLSTFFNILNKGLVFCNGLLVAYFFTVHTSTDLFFYVYNSVLILGAYFTSMNGTVLIPESMRIRTEKGEHESMRFLNFFLYGYAAIAILSIVLVSFDPVSFFSVVSNFDNKDLVNHRFLLYMSLPLFAMICIINLFVDILTSHKFFTVPMLVGIINGSVSILFVVLFHNVFGIASVFYGLLLSYSTNLVLLITLMKKRLHWKFNLVQRVRDRRVWNNYGFAQLGNFTSTLSTYTPMYILSGYSTGIITALTFAQQLSSLPTMLITYQFSSVAGIKFNELYARKDTTEINRVFSESANFLHFLLIPLSCFIFFYSAEIVQFILGFTSLNANAAEYVSLFLRFLGFLLPLYVMNSLIARLFMASHKIRQSFWYQVLFNLVLIAGLFFAVKYFGPVGYPIVMVAAYVLNLGACYLIEKYYFNFIDYKSIMERFGLFLIINILISTSIYFAVRNIEFEHPLPKLILAFFLYLGILLLVNQQLGMNKVITATFVNLKNRVTNKNQHL